ncbi:TPA: transcriptional regulator [Candidatus Dependentiae bacterium]|nr:MAG: hypothetical protein UR14_C0002G0061 [candidate division TM6 bacterium GW2011_GWE2_31_21]KKP53858.1 MAG: hypothetical protein UR43_C0002G0061 [candidate division TM6 bacterium GW2011_GWF2_33_332]HBS47638.1 transcriptional regulator [Candidatus Dependentiae bacterium]HBZ73787.1 transcriptional regulator [Candidatus Dependentiae bacterium]
MNNSKLQIPICQSCAMPMQRPEDFGTNLDKTQNKEYCCHCFRNGKFSEPNLTKIQMIENCVNVMNQMQMPQEKIEQIKIIISSLKRWK